MDAVQTVALSQQAAQCALLAAAIDPLLRAMPEGPTRYERERSCEQLVAQQTQLAEQQQRLLEGLRAELQALQDEQRERLGEFSTRTAINRRPGDEGPPKLQHRHLMP